jgi:hypothetical protein
MSGKKGRHPVGVGFVVYPGAMLTDREFVALPAPARVIYLAMSKQHRHANPHRKGNNGMIPYGCAAGAKAAKISLMHASRMLNLLRGADLLRRHKPGTMRAHPDATGEAAEWEITIFPAKGRMPAKRYNSTRKLHIEHRVLESPAYQRLSNTAKCVLPEMMRRFDGNNNGALRFGGEDGAAAGFPPRMTERALKQLETERFIVETAPAIPQQGRRRAWRLTMYRVGRKAPTMDFLQAPGEHPERNIGDAKMPDNVTLVTLRSFLAVCVQAGLIPPYREVIRQKSPDLPIPEEANLSDTHVNPIESHSSARRALLPSSRAAAALRSLPPPRPSKPPPWSERKNLAETANSTDKTAITEQSASKPGIAGGKR